MNRTQAAGPPDENSKCRRERSRGAALVEFAMVAPLLFLLVFGIIEFGLVLGQKLDVSHAAREGARLAAVNYQATTGSTGSTQTAEIVAETCARMELASDSNISISFAAGTTVGDTVEVEVRIPVNPVTGVFDAMLSDTVLSSTVSTRLEQVATFVAVTNSDCP